MSTHLDESRHEAEQAEHCRCLETAVRNGVLRALGQPPGLQAVRARRVFGDKYRVDVFVASGPATRVAHSYFVTADDQGTILRSNPGITRLY